MKKLKAGLVVTASLLCLASAAPVFAQSVNGGRPPGRGAPGPLAGAGLPFLIAIGAAGAYKLVRRRRDGSRQQQGGTERR